MVEIEAGDGGEWGVVDCGRLKQLRAERKSFCVFLLGLDERFPGVAGIPSTKGYTSSLVIG